jgi:hypothetical protein
LLGQHLRRGHDRALPPGLDGREERGDGDHRLAAADVALQEPAHRPLGAHVGEELFDDALLGDREPERELLQERVEQAAVSRVRGAQLRGFQAHLAGGEASLDQEELVED